MLPDLVQNRQHGDVGLSCSGGCTDQQVLVCFVRSVEHNRLDQIQTLGVLERCLANLRYLKYKYIHTE